MPRGRTWSRFLRDITDKHIRRDSVASMPELELASDLLVARRDIEPTPSVQTATASDILANATRAKRPFSPRLLDQYGTAPRGTLVERHVKSIDSEPPVRGPSRPRTL